MTGKGIFPFLLLFIFYAVIAGFIYACCTLWYSNIPERVSFAQFYLGFAADAILVAIGATGILIAITGGFVMTKMKVINRTWLLFYLIAPLLIGIMLAEIIYLLSFAE